MQNSIGSEGQIGQIVVLDGVILSNKEKELVQPCFLEIVDIIKEPRSGREYTLKVADELEATQIYEISGSWLYEPNIWWKHKKEKFDKVISNKNTKIETLEAQNNFAKEILSAKSIVAISNEQYEKLSK